MTKWETGFSLMETARSPKGRCSPQSPLEDEVWEHFFF